jgi:hypothetical protein
MRKCTYPHVLQRSKRARLPHKHKSSAGTNIPQEGFKIYRDKQNYHLLMSQERPCVLLLAGFEGDVDVGKARSILEAQGFTVHYYDLLSQALEFIAKGDYIVMVVTEMRLQDSDEGGLKLTKVATERDARIFNIVFSKIASSNALLKSNCHRLGAHMVTSGAMDLCYRVATHIE